MRQDSEVIQFTPELLLDIVTEVVIQNYYDYPKIQEMYSIDDLVQENILYFYKPMKSGKQRLQHYLDTCPLPQVINTIKRCTRQTFNELLRYNKVKNNPLSLNGCQFKDDEDSKEWIDLVKDNSESIDSKIDCEDLYNAIKECSDLYSNSKQTTAELIEDHLAIVQDLIEGYKKSELRLKYKDFDIKLKHVQEIIETFYKSQGTSIEKVLGY